MAAQYTRKRLWSCNTPTLAKYRGVLARFTFSALLTNAANIKTVREHKSCLETGNKAFELNDLFVELLSNLSFPQVSQCNAQCFHVKAKSTVHMALPAKPCLRPPIAGMPPGLQASQERSEDLGGVSSEPQIMLPPYLDMCHIYTHSLSINFA